MIWLDSSRGASLFSLPVLFGVTLLIYVLLWFAPGDPALSSLGIYATPEQLETLRQQLDLDKPIYVLYVRWLGQIIRGDFGVSLITKEYVSTLNWAQPFDHSCN